MAGPKRKSAAKAFRGAETIEIWPVDRLRAYARNSRTHSDEQVAKVAASIERFGFTNPILAAEDGTIIAGHGRLLAAQALGMTEVPVIVAGGWSDAERRAYVIADNQLALEAGWDEEILKLELGELRDAGFDLALTGFGADDLAGLLDGPADGIEAAPASSYSEQYGVIAICVSEASQKETYERLVALGYTCKVVTT